MQLLMKAMLIIAGIIHVLPLPGLIGATHLERLYDIAITDPNILVMMRHRAMLFGLLGAIMIYAAFQRDLATIAIVAGLISAASFIWLAWSIGGYNTAIARIVVADLVAVGCLAVAAVCHVVGSQKS